MLLPRAWTSTPRQSLSFGLGSVLAVARFEAVDDPGLPGARADDCEVAVHPVRLGEAELAPRVVVVTAPAAEREPPSVYLDPAAGAARGDGDAPGTAAGDESRRIPAGLVRSEPPGTDRRPRASRDDHEVCGAGAGACVDDVGSAHVAKADPRR